MTATSTATGWYVYGVVDPAGRELATPLGVGGGTSAQLVEHGSLAAIVSRVALDEFDEAALRERLNDRAWLEANALAHEEVLRAFAEVMAVVPLRFGTVYRELANVGELLDERSDQLHASLARVRGRVELGVKAWVDRERLESAQAGRAATGTSATSTGRSYLEQRLHERDAAADAAELCAGIVHDAHERLLRLAVDGVVNRAQPRELTGRPEQMALNAAYLVAATDQARVAAEVARLDHETRALGITFELTGPWPAHNFVSAEEGRP